MPGVYLADGVAASLNTFLKICVHLQFLSPYRRGRSAGNPRLLRDRLPQPNPDYKTLAQFIFMCHHGPMNTTKAEARAAIGAENDNQLAKALGVSHQRLYRYRDDQPLAEALQWRLKDYLEKHRDV